MIKVHCPVCRKKTEIACTAHESYLQDIEYDKKNNKILYGDPIEYYVIEHVFMCSECGYEHPFHEDQLLEILKGNVKV